MNLTTIIILLLLTSLFVFSYINREDIDTNKINIDTIFNKIEELKTNYDPHH